MFKKAATLASLSLMLAAGIVMTNHSSAEAGWTETRVGNYTFIRDHVSGFSATCSRIGSYTYCN